MRYAKRQAEHKELALEHIRSLFEQAVSRFPKQPAFAHRYAQLAHRIALKYKVRLPQQLKRRICKHCHHYLQPGANCRVRLTQQKVVYHCLDCKHHMRFPYKPSRRARQAR